MSAAERRPPQPLGASDSEPVQRASERDPLRTIDDDLRRAALRTSTSILSLQRRAEEELHEAQRALQSQAESLAQSNMLLHTTLESSPVGIMAVSRVGRITAFNTKVAQMFHVTAATRDRRDFAEWSGSLARQSSDSLSVLSRLRQLINTESTAARQGVVELRGGRVFEYAAAPLARDGTVSGVVLNWLDVSDRRRAEAEQALLQEQLRESQKMESIGSLAGGIAHDFNNILGAILGNIVLAKQALADGQSVEESLTSIQVASERATRLVQQILTFSRRQRQHVERLSLRALLTEAAGLLRATIPSGISIELDTDDATPDILGDPTQLHQVIMNLGSNAMNAVRERAGMDGGTGRIALRLAGQRCTDTQSLGDGTILLPGHYAVLRVSDDGVGMDAATRERIFEPFFTTRRTGTGIGLSVVHGILAAHHGHLVLETALGAGTTFSLYFPAADEAAMRDADTPQDVRERTPGGSRSVAVLPTAVAERRVLVIDDEPMLVSIALRLLKREGYHAVGYTDAMQALEEIRANGSDIELVVTDFNMPRLSGLELALAVRRARPEIPIVLSSGYLTQELEQEASRAGVELVISKTELVTSLVSIVDRLVRT